MLLKVYHLLVCLVMLLVWRVESKSAGSRSETLCLDGVGIADDNLLTGIKRDPIGRTLISRFADDARKQKKQLTNSQCNSDEIYDPTLSKCIKVTGGIIIFGFGNPSLGGR